MHERNSQLGSVDDRVAALQALETSAVRKLTLYAKASARGLSEEGSDLLQSAYTRWLQSDEPVGTVKDTERYLFSAINSLRSNAFRRQRSEKRAFGDRLEPDPDDPAAVAPVETIAGTESSQADQLYAQQLYDAVKDTDEEVALFILKMADNATRAETMEDLGWDDKKYEAVQKRKNRKILKLIQQGKI